MPNRIDRTTQILIAAAAGEPESNERLLLELYDELRDIAEAQLSREGAGHTLQATALVNEVYLKLIAGDRIEARSRTHFKAIAARAMGQVLIDHARVRGAVKRGRHWERVELDEAAQCLEMDTVDASAMSDALLALAELDQRKADIVRLRFLGGLSNAETASFLGVSRSTVQYDWRVARAWLRRELLREEAQARRSAPRPDHH